MKRDRDEEGYEDELRRPEKIRDIDSEPEDVIGSQDSFSQGPSSPFVFNYESSPQTPTDQDSMSDSESIFGSQSLSQPASPLTQEDLTRALRAIDEFLNSPKLEELRRSLIAPLSGYPGIFKNQDQPTIQSMLSSVGSIEPMTTSSPEPLEQDRVLPVQSFLPVSEPVVEKEIREEVREEIPAEPGEKLDEVAEMEEEPAEVELDAETAIYIGQAAEQIFDDALIELIDGAIEQAKSEVPEAGIPAQAIRMEMLYDPELKTVFDSARSESLEDLKAEILDLLKQEDMVEE